MASQLTLGYEHQEEIAPAAVEPVKREIPLPRQHPPMGDIVKRLIADGSLDFLDITRMANPKSEVKPMGKRRFGGKPKWFSPSDR